VHFYTRICQEHLFCQETRTLPAPKSGAYDKKTLVCSKKLAQIVVLVDELKRNPWQDGRRRERQRPTYNILTPMTTQQEYLRNMNMLMIKSSRKHHLTHWLRKVIDKRPKLSCAMTTMEPNNIDGMIRVAK
jgi:hypothetical protein